MFKNDCFMYKSPEFSIFFINTMAWVTAPAVDFQMLGNQQGQTYVILNNLKQRSNTIVAAPWKMFRQSRKYFLQQQLSARWIDRPWTVHRCNIWYFCTRFEGIHQFNFIFLEMKSSSMYSITGTEALIYLLIFFPADWSAENIEKNDLRFSGECNWIPIIVKENKRSYMGW